MDHKIFALDFLRVNIVKRICVMIVCAAALAVLASGEGQAGSRIKDIAYVLGVRGEQVLGYGLAVGLAGTGDTQRSSFTVQSVTSMLKRFGITVPQTELRLRNVAAVMITATVPAFTKPGGQTDITVSSMGDATSLQGGTLLMTPLSGLDGEVYAMAQGSISVGGFDVRSSTGARVGKNHTAAGRVPNGATVERAIATSFGDTTKVSLVLHQPDFTTSKHIAVAINKALGEDLAQSVDANTVAIKVPPTQTQNLVGFISILESLEVEVDAIARVVINERTGTIVMGKQVRVAPVAIMHGNLSVEVQTTLLVSQPPPLSQGTTQVVPQDKVVATEERAKNVILKEGATVEDLVRALSAIGSTPRDIIAILQSLKAAGALDCDVEVI